MGTSLHKSLLLALWHWSSSLASTLMLRGSVLYDVIRLIELCIKISLPDCQRGQSIKDTSLFHSDRVYKICFSLFPVDWVFIGQRNSQNWSGAFFLPRCKRNFICWLNWTWMAGLKGGTHLRLSLSWFYKRHLGQLFCPFLRNLLFTFLQCVLLS